MVSTSYMQLYHHQKHTTYPSCLSIRQVTLRAHPCYFKQTRAEVRRLVAPLIIPLPTTLHGVVALCLVLRMQGLGDDRNGMCGIWQDKAVVLIVFLCTSSSVSHYCVQTRGDVYSAETSKSTALGCNLVTPFSLLLPALLKSSPGPATPGAHWPIAAAECLLSTRTKFFGINPSKKDDAFLCVLSAWWVFG